MKTRTPKTKIITGCKECPFIRRWRSGTPFCQLDGSVKIYNSNELLSLVEGGTFVPITPEACPIKTQPIIVTYET